MSSGPHVGDELEKYYARLRKVGRDALADWEQDPAFIAIAAARWPDDLEGSAQGRESNRMRMRLRHEGFVVITRARQEVEALRWSCNAALEAWSRPGTDLDSPIDEALDLSVRASNVLLREGPHYPAVTTVGELILLTPNDLLRRPHCGKRVLDEYRQELAKLGLHLKGEPK